MGWQTPTISATSGPRLCTALRYALAANYHCNNNYNNYYYLVRHVPRLASGSCSSMQRGSSSAAGRPSSYCSQSASCERLATAPHAAPARPR